jgi:hypothetical protein
MPTTITTEAARHAIAERQRARYKEDTDRQISARLAELGVQPSVMGVAALAALLKRDPVLKTLGLLEFAHERLIRFYIENGCVPTIQGDGTVCWKTPSGDVIRGGRA